MLVVDAASFRMVRPTGGRAVEFPEIDAEVTRYKPEHGQ